MITSLGIQNFKSIRQLNIPLSKLTVLSGLNSSGKSTVIQGIRILERFNHKKTPILLPGSGDLRHMAHASLKPVIFSCVRMSGKEQIRSSYSALAYEFASKDTSATNFLTDQNPVSDDMRGSEDEKYPNCIYIGAERLGPQNFLPTKDSSAPLYDFGEKCEYVYEFIERFGDSPVTPAVCHPYARGNTLNYNIIGWLQEIAPGTDFKISESDRRHGILAVDFDGHTPIHVGFGLSCILPVIVAALGITIPYTDPEATHPILLIENPEAHLHPQGQTKIAELIALATKNGVQIVVETHSDHFIDGIRLAVKERQIDCKDVALHYFSKNEGQGTTVESPVLNENGKLSFWPEGFGDQMMINRARLARS